MDQVVYLTAGAAVPAVIEATFQSLLNDSFDEAFKKINDVSTVPYRTAFMTVIICETVARNDDLQSSLLWSPFLRLLC